MNACYPKVLFVAHCAFNHIIGGGMISSDLFAGWPKDNIATISRYNDAEPITTDGSV